MADKLSADEQIAQEEAKLTDELAGKPAPVSEPVAATPPAEEPKEPASEEKKPEEPALPKETQTATEDEDLSKFSAKAQKRFQELNDRAKKAETLEQEVKRLKELIYKPPVIPDAPKAPEKAQVNPLLTMLDQKLPSSGQQTDEILTPEELDKRTREIAERTWQENNRQKAIADRLNFDIMRIEDEYEELRKPTDASPNAKFNQDLVKQISDQFNRMWKSDQTVSLYEYTKWLMGLRKQGAEEARRSDAATLNRQAAEQAIDPSGVPSKAAESNVEDKIRNAKNSDDLAKLEKLLPHA